MLYYGIFSVLNLTLLAEPQEGYLAEWRIYKSGGHFQVYISKSVQSLAYFFHIKLIHFFISKQG